MPARTVTPESLDGHPFFGSFSRGERKALLSAGVFNDYKASAPVFLQGDTSREMYVVVQGECEISISTKDGDEVLAILGPGDFFGEGSLLTSETRSATVVATSPTTLLALHPGSIDILREKEPVVLAAFYEKLLRVVFERLRTTNKRLAKR